MRTKVILFLTLIFAVSISAQDFISGTVSEKNENGKLTPLIGANVVWADSKSGAATDLNGFFRIPRDRRSERLIVSMIGYHSDTVFVSNQTNLEIVLSVEPKEMRSVEVVGETNSTIPVYMDIENKLVMTNKELYKAACCNLSESFETNPSIDVSFTDAITGVKQIEMLGLSGIYTQTTLENLPYIRGLMSTVGLTFIPGSWVQAINVSKGIGSVANGFESITGQIDVDLHKPDSEDGKPLFLNLYGDYDQRFEGNLNYKLKLNDNISAITLLHTSSRNHSFDLNNDRFTDMPKFSVYNIMQRWHITPGIGWEGQIGFQYVNDEKDGGTSTHADTPLIDHQPVPSVYNYSIDNSHFNIYGKFGYVFQEEGYKSFGFQWSYNNYSNSSRFGNRNYDGNEKTGYLNFIYQSMIGSREHKFRTGLSFVFDQYDESFMSNTYKRIERIPGAFFEYTYTLDETFSMIFGIRADQHNEYGLMITPRFHLRFAPQEDWIFRAVAGRGFRTSNIFTEYSSVFASSRKINIDATGNFGYGLQQEKAWNYGFNVIHYFYYDYREATISLDFYRTDFERLTIGDLDSNPQAVNFSSVQNGSYSNSVQVELNIEPFERVTTRAAYRYMDVKQKINGTLMDRPFSSKNRALLNFGYSTEKESSDDPQMVYDLTVQWFDKKRIPSTSSNPAGLQAREYSPAFALVNAQISRTFYAGFDLYIGIENIFGFRQKDLIIDPANPNGKYFDASLVWGPVNGRMAYAGIRYKI